MELSKRIARYINREEADPIAVGLLCELQTHLRAANRGAENATQVAHNFMDKFYDEHKNNKN